MLAVSSSLSSVVPTSFRNMLAIPVNLHLSPLRQMKHIRLRVAYYCINKLSLSLLIEVCNEMPMITLIAKNVRILTAAIYVMDTKHSREVKVVIPF